MRVRHMMYVPNIYRPVPNVYRGRTCLCRTYISPCRTCIVCRTSFGAEHVCAEHTSSPVDTEFKLGLMSVFSRRCWHSEDIQYGAFSRFEQQMTWLHFFNWATMNHWLLWDLLRSEDYIVLRTRESRDCWRSKIWRRGLLWRRKIGDWKTSEDFGGLAQFFLTLFNRKKVSFQLSNFLQIFILR